MNRNTIIRVAIPMLALSASYGVGSYAALYVHPLIAWCEAAAFELVYIGLALMNLPPYQRQRARAISKGAVVVSVVYNALAAFFHRMPTALDNMWPVFEFLFAVIHAAPLATMAYLVADLVLHQQDGSELDKPVAEVLQPIYSPPAADSSHTTETQQLIAINTTELQEQIAAAAKGLRDRKLTAAEFDNRLAEILQPVK